MRVRSRNLILGVAIAVAMTSLAAPAGAAVPRPSGPSEGGQDPATTASQSAPSLRRASVSMLATTPSVALATCADDPAWLCGSLPVPIDRADPHGRQISIGFTVLPHTDPASTARDALVFSQDGPGAPSSGARGSAQFVLGPLTAQRDLLLIDDRGTGTSAPIDCPAIQRDPFGREIVIAAITECGQQLGPDADRYGSGDIALDMDAVRSALGYPQITYYAPAYGTVHEQAYAIRFPHRIRALVADSGSPVNDPAHIGAWGTDLPPGFARVAGLICRRAPACVAAHPHAESALAWLARAVRRHPVEGMVRDSSGTPRPVRVDETSLVFIVAFQRLNLGELASAAEALASGDSAPLLRMKLEVLPEPSGEPGPGEDPAVDSKGAFAAQICNDQDFVWNRTDPVSVRQAKYDRALAALGRSAFAPFSPPAWEEFIIPDMCRGWPAPDRFTPAVPRSATVSGVPTLILAGDLNTDFPVDTSRAVRQVFRGATYRLVAGAGNPAAGWSQCARDLLQSFVTDPKSFIGRCDTPAYVAPAVPQFPRIAAEATPAAPLAGDASTRLDRRVATVAVRTALDGWLRAFRDGPSGSGLRGGMWDADFDSFPDHAVLVLRDSRFAGDVSVSGQSERFYESNEMHLELTVSGPQGHTGNLVADGQFGFGGPFNDFVVSGALGGNAIRASVPAN